LDFGEASRGGKKSSSSSSIPSLASNSFPIADPIAGVIIVVVDPNVGQ
jgi:hypothetical protein